MNYQFTSIIAMELTAIAVLLLALIAVILHQDGHVRFWREADRLQIVFGKFQLTVKRRD